MCLASIGILILGSIWLIRSGYLRSDLPAGSNLAFILSTDSGEMVFAFLGGCFYFRTCFGMSHVRVADKTVECVVRREFSSPDKVQPELAN